MENASECASEGKLCEQDSLSFFERREDSLAESQRGMKWRLSVDCETLQHLEPNVAKIGQGKQEEDLERMNLMVGERHSKVR